MNSGFNTINKIQIFNIFAILVKKKCDINFCLNNIFHLKKYN